MVSLTNYTIQGWRGAQDATSRWSFFNKNVRKQSRRIFLVFKVSCHIPVVSTYMLILNCICRVGKVDKIKKPLLLLVYQYKQNKINTYLQLKLREPHKGLLRPAALRRTLPYSLKFSRIKYFAVLPNSDQKQIFTNKIFVFWLPALHCICHKLEISWEKNFAALLRPVKPVTHEKLAPV